MSVGSNVPSIDCPKIRIDGSCDATTGILIDPPVSGSTCPVMKARSNRNENVPSKGDPLGNSCDSPLSPNVTMLLSILSGPMPPGPVTVIVWAAAVAAASANGATARKFFPSP